MLGPMTYGNRSIMVTEHVGRRQAVDTALTDSRLEGTLPSNGVRVLMERFVEGEMTEADLIDCVLHGKRN